MKQVICQIMGCWVAVFLTAASSGAMAHPLLIPVADEGGAFCLDSMETDPVADDLDPTPIAVDGGCMVTEIVISI